jgi:hypothetical protein
VIQKSNIFIQQFAQSVLWSTLLILHIEALFDSMLYIESIVALLMPLFTIVQLFIDKLLYVLMITILLSLVAMIVTTNLM